MRSKLLGIALGPVVAGSMLLAAAPAYAAPASSAVAAPAAQPAGSITAPVTGAVNGVASSGTLTITNFINRAGQTLAAGTLNLGGVTQQVQVPVSPAASSGSCEVLDLVLGPLHLDLLGLVVDLNQVHLNITAQQGPGNLLGNLLCAVANLLNGSGGGGGLAGLLNQILGQL